MNVEKRIKFRVYVILVISYYMDIVCSTSIIRLPESDLSKGMRSLYNTVFFPKLLELYCPRLLSNFFMLAPVLLLNTVSRMKQCL